MVVLRGQGGAEEHVNLFFDYISKIKVTLTFVFYPKGSVKCIVYFQIKVFDDDYISLCTFLDVFC